MLWGHPRLDLPWLLFSQFDSFNHSLHDQSSHHEAASGRDKLQLQLSEWRELVQGKSLSSPKAGCWQCKRDVYRDNEIASL